MATIFKDGNLLKKVRNDGPYQPSTLDLQSKKADKIGTADIKITDSSRGVILVDRSTGTSYRLFIEDGNLGIEEV